MKKNIYTTTLKNGIIVKVNVKNWTCPHFCGRCNLGVTGVKTCKAQQNNTSSSCGCSYLISLSTVPYYPV